MRGNSDAQTGAARAVLALPMRSSRAENSSLKVRGLRRPEGSGLLIDDPLDEGSKASSTSTSSGGGELIPQNERKLRRSDGSGMLIHDPLGEEQS